MRVRENDIRPLSEGALMQAAYGWPPQRLLTKYEDTSCQRAGCTRHTHALTHFALPLRRSLHVCVEVRSYASACEIEVQVEGFGKLQVQRHMPSALPQRNPTKAHRSYLLHTQAPGWMCECKLWWLLLKCKCVRCPFRQRLRRRRRSQRSWWVCTLRQSNGYVCVFVVVKWAIM